MTRWTNWLVLIVPALLAWVLAIVLTLSSFPGFLILLAIVVPLFVIIAAASIALGTIYAVGRAKEHDPASLRLIGFLALGLSLSVVSFAIAAFTAGPIVHAAREPVRSVLARRILQRAHARPTSARTEIRLRGPEALLADGGRVEVYLEDGRSGVLFWDWTGIMSGGASVYMENPDASQPPQAVVDVYDVRHDGGHWWTATEPD